MFFCFFLLVHFFLLGFSWHNMTNNNDKNLSYKIINEEDAAEVIGLLETRETLTRIYITCARPAYHSYATQEEKKLSPELFNKKGVASCGETSGFYIKHTICIKKRNNESETENEKSDKTILNLITAHHAETLQHLRLELHVNPSDYRRLFKRLVNIKTLCIDFDPIPSLDSPDSELLELLNVLPTVPAALQINGIHFPHKMQGWEPLSLLIAGPVNSLSVKRILPILPGSFPMPSKQKNFDDDGDDVVADMLQSGVKRERYSKIPRGLEMITFNATGVVKAEFDVLINLDLKVLFGLLPNVVDLTIITIDSYSGYKVVMENWKWMSLMSNLSKLTCVGWDPVGTAGMKKMSISGGSSHDNNNNNNNNSMMLPMYTSEEEDVLRNLTSFTMENSFGIESYWHAKLLFKHLENITHLRLHNVRISSILFTSENDQTIKRGKGGKGRKPSRKNPSKSQRTAEEEGEGEEDEEESEEEESEPEEDEEVDNDEKSKKRKRKRKEETKNKKKPSVKKEKENEEDENQNGEDEDNEEDEEEEGDNKSTKNTQRKSRKGVGKGGKYPFIHFTLDKLKHLELGVDIGDILRPKRIGDYIFYARIFNLLDITPNLEHLELLQEFRATFIPKTHALIKKHRCKLGWNVRNHPDDEQTRKILEEKGIPKDDKMRVCKTCASFDGKFSRHKKDFFDYMARKFRKVIPDIFIEYNIWESRPDTQEDDDN